MVIGGNPQKLRPPVDSLPAAGFAIVFGGATLGVMLAVTVGVVFGAMIVVRPHVACGLI